MASEKTPLTIFLINFDWRDIFRTDVHEMNEKLVRDQLNPDLNNFFFFSWARMSYEVDGEHYSTRHIRTYGLEKVRPTLDIVALFAVPWVAYKKHVRPDVWSSYDFGMVPALWIAKCFFGGKIVMVLNNQPHIYSKTRRFGWIKGLYSWIVERIGIRFVDHIFTINTTMKEYIKSLGLPEENITVFAMDTIIRDEVYIRNAQKGVIRAKYSIPHDTKVLVTAARLEAEKNYPKLLELFAGLGDGYVLFCLGMGSLQAQLEAQAETLGIRDRVHFEGFVQRRDIWNYYNDADVFVLLSNVEALGIVFWEAMYARLPALGSNVDGILESIGSDGDRGRVWKHGGTQKEFTDAITFCTTPSAERSLMLERARQFVDAQIKNRVTVNDIASPHTR